MRERDIMHENGNFWVSREQFKGRTVYRVLENVGTHSMLRGTYDLGKVVGRGRAIADCDERAAKAARRAANAARIDANMPWRHP